MVLLEDIVVQLAVLVVLEDIIAQLDLMGALQVVGDQIEESIINRTTRNNPWSFHIIFPFINRCNIIGIFVLILWVLELALKYLNSFKSTKWIFKKLSQTLL